MKKYISEFMGSLILVLLGCGVAAITGGSILVTALAFGLTIIVMSYLIGNISGCHLNPAVSLSMLLSKRISLKDFIYYIISQILGCFCGSAILALLLGSFDVLGANSYGGLGQLADTIWIALLIETILSFIFITVILNITSKKEYNSISGIIIGTTLILLHLMGIPFTGLSVNPARSLAPALLQGGEALNQVWVFIVAPLLGSLLSVLFNKYILEKR